MMATDMIESCIQRTDGSFQSWLKKGGVPFISTDYIVPTEMCAMINVMLDAKNQSFKLTSVEGVDLVKNISFSNQLFKRFFRKSNMANSVFFYCFLKIAVLKMVNNMMIFLKDQKKVN